MSTESFPAVEQYFTLLDQSTRLQEQATLASDQTRDLFEQGYRAAELKLAELSQNRDVQTYMAELGAPIVAALAELDELSPAVELGLIEASDIESRRQSILGEVQADSRLDAAVKFLGIASVTLAVESTPEPVVPEVEQPTETAIPETPEAILTPTVETAGEKKKRPIKITVGNGIVKIGDGGKIIKASSKIYDSQRDYSAERITVLKTLINNQGTELKARTLWELSFPEVEFDGHAMGQIKSWVTSLTHGRRPIVIHNGHRGPASAYGIYNFDVTLVEKDTTERLLSGESQTPIESVLLSDTVSENSPSNGEQSDAGCGFPLTIEESVIFAEFLDINKNVLFSLDLDLIPDNVIDQLRNLFDKSTETKTMFTAGQIAEQRRTIIEKMRAFFADEDLVLSVMDRIETSDDRYALFEYLCQSEAVERWKLFDELASARRVVTAKIDTSRHSSYTIQATEPLILVDGAKGEFDLLGHNDKNHRDPRELPRDEEDEQIMPAISVQTTSSAETELVELIPVTGESVIVHEEAVASSVSVVEYTVVEPVGVEQKQERNTSVRDDFEASLRVEISEQIETIVRLNLTAKRRQSIQAVPDYKWLTARKLRNASENGIISRDSKDLTMVDLLNLYCSHLHASAWNQSQRSSTKPDRPLIETIIRDEIRSYEKKSTQS